MAKHSLGLHLKYPWKSQNAIDVFTCLAGLKIKHYPADFYGKLRGMLG